MKVIDNPPPQKNDNTARLAEIQQILKELEIGKGVEIETDNIAAWRTSFKVQLTRYNENERVIPKEFTIKKVTQTKYNVWRTA